MTRPLPLRPWLLFVLLLGVSPAIASSGPAPADLRVGDVTLMVTDIYGREELEDARGLIRFVRGTMNAVHTGTRHGIIRRELLFRPGDSLDLDALHETERNLRGLGYLTNVAVVPLDTLPDGRVPLEVRVQETWSLTTQVSYSRSSNGDRWSVSGSDKNFLGRGATLEAGLGEDEDRSFRSLVFADRRVFGSPLTLRAVYADYSDGGSKSLHVSRSYLRDDGDWSLDVSAWDVRNEPRYYLSSGGGADRLYAKLPLHEDGFAVETSRRLSPVGQGRIWRLGLGVYSRVRRYDRSAAVTLSDGRVVEADLIATAHGGALLRESGRLLEPNLVLDTHGRTWIATTHVLCYGPTEDLFLDPWVVLRAGPTPTALGSDRERLMFNGRVRDWSRLGGGWLLTDLTVDGSHGSPRNRYLITDVSAGWFVRPGRRDVTRITAEAAYGKDLEGTDAFVLGLTRGLRSLEYDGRVGDRLVRWNAEHAHLLPGELLGFYTVGLAAFYAGGSAWWNGVSPAFGRTRHELGLGLRFGPTRSASADVARLDLSWPLDGGGLKLTAATSGFF